MSAPSPSQFEPIPSEIIDLKEIYERRFFRRKEILESKQRDFAKDLEPFVAAHRKAVHSYEDHFDDGLLKYGRDPNKMLLDERDAKEVKKARMLKRAIEDSEHAVRQKEAELTQKLRASSEFKELSIAQSEFENWLAKISLHLKCCPADLDWKERKINRVVISSESTIPSDLLSVPKD